MGGSGPHGRGTRSRVGPSARGSPAGARGARAAITAASGGTSRALSAADAAAAVALLPPSSRPRVVYAGHWLGDRAQRQIFLTLEVVDPASGNLLDLGLIIEGAIWRPVPPGGGGPPAGPSSEAPRDPPAP